MFSGQGGFDEKSRCRSVSTRANAVLLLVRGLTRVPENELDNPGGVLQGVGMMANTRFADHLDLATQLLESLLDYGRVFCDGYDLVTGPHDMQERNLHLRQRGQLINGIPPELQRFCLGQAIGLQAGLPAAGTSLAASLAPWPTLEVTDRGISVNTANLLGIGRGPVVDDQAAAAHALQGDFCGELVVPGEVLVETIPVFDRGRATVEVCHVTVDKVEPLLEQDQVRLGFMPEEAGAPDPGFSLGCVSWCHDNTAALLMDEVKSLVTIPNRLLPGKWFSVSGCMKDQQVAHCQQHNISQAVCSHRSGRLLGSGLSRRLLSLSWSLVDCHPRGCLPVYSKAPVCPGENARRFRYLLSVLRGLLVVPPVFSDEAVEIGKFRQLFLDDHVIASLWYIHRTFPRLGRVPGQVVCWQQQKKMSRLIGQGSGAEKTNLFSFWVDCAKAK